MDLLFSTSTSMSAALVLDALVGADGPAEGLADLRVLDRHVEHLLGAPAHLGAERRRVARSSTRRERRPARPAAPSSASAPTVTSAHVTSQSLRVWSIVGSSLTSSPGVPRGTRKSADAVLGARPEPRARGHHDGVGGVGVGHEELGAGQRVPAAGVSASQRDARRRRACALGSIQASVDALVARRRSSAATPSSAPRCPPRGRRGRPAARWRSTGPASPRGPSPP